jgi:hypothetical protein
MKRKADSGKAVKSARAGAQRSVRRRPSKAAPTKAASSRIEIVAEKAADPVPHLLLRVSGILDEDSLSDYFERVGQAIVDTQSRRILADLRTCSVRLSIADMHGLVKMAAARFAGFVDRLALVLSPSDIPPEKFFEPALTSRGVPTMATETFDDAVDWLAAKLRLGR